MKSKWYSVFSRLFAKGLINGSSGASHSAVPLFRGNHSLLNSFPFLAFDINYQLLDKVSFGARMGIKRVL